jgi:hypothetical protein
MHFPTLFEQCDPPADIASLAAELIARKAVTRELGEAPLPPVIDRFLEAEFDAARGMLPSEPVALSPSAKAAAEALFREAVTRFDPAGSTRGA